MSPSQVKELIIGNAVAAETTVDTFVADASNQEIKVLSTDGTAPAENKPFKLYQKTGATGNLGYEFSDTIDPKKVVKVTVKEFEPEVQKSVAITGFDGNVTANTTYVAEIRLYNEGGSLSVENFAVISGYFVTGSNVTNVTAADIRDGIEASLRNNLVNRGDSEFVLTTPDTSETDLVITGKEQAVSVGRIQGRQIKFDVIGKSFDNVSILHENTGLLSTEVLEKGTPGTGTGKYAVNKEWDLKGFKYEVYRETSYPANFNTPYYANIGSDYNAVHVKYFSDRQSPTVEKQQKELIMLVERADLAGNAVTNSLLADLRTAIGDNAVIAADLDIA